MIVTQWLRKLWYLINRRRFERQLQQDMETHREMMAEPQRFGNTLRLKESSRDVWGWNWLDDLWRDLGSSVRTLRQSPWFTIGSVIILSLGLGMNLTMFQFLNVTYFKPLPIRDPNNLVLLNWVPSNNQPQWVPYRAVETIGAYGAILSSIFTSYPTHSLVGEASESLQTMFVSTNWFDEFGNAAIGRVFQTGRDDRSDSEPVVVVNHRFWERNLQSNPQVLGQTIRINDRPAVLIGVASEKVPGMSGAPEIWMPMNQYNYFNRGGAPEISWNQRVNLYGRLKPGISVSAAREALRGAFIALAAEQPTLFHKTDWLGWGGPSLPRHWRARESVSP